MCSRSLNPMLMMLTFGPHCNELLNSLVDLRCSSMRLVVVVPLGKIFIIDWSHEKIIYDLFPLSHPGDL